jgi:hypothetical protein
MTDYPVTPDGRYFVVRGRLWRRANPALPEAEKTRLVHALMLARAAIAKANRLGDDTLRREARQQVHDAKVALGERGPIWWDDGSPDYNRRLVRNTPYREWFEQIPGTPTTASGQ